MSEGKNDTKHVDSAAIEAMFKAGAHFGYSRARRHASVRAHLYGAKNGVDIINLEETVQMLDAAKERMRELGKIGKIVLFVGTKQEVRPIVEAVATSLNMPYVAERWVGGILTNWPEIRKRTARLKELSDKFAKGDLEKYTKKERLLFEREMAKLHTEFGGIANLEGTPAAVVIVDPREEHIAVAESKKMKVETIALLNSDCNKNEITYPILANDSALESVKFFLEALSKAFEEGVKMRS
jgi:small subunit ribosomal protein S2